MIELSLSRVIERMKILLAFVKENYVVLQIDVFSLQLHYDAMQKPLAYVRWIT